MSRSPSPPPEMFRSAADGRFDLLATLASTISSDMEIDAILAHVVEQLARAFPAYRSSYATIDDAARLSISHVGAPEGVVRGVGMGVDLGSAPAYVAALRGREAVVVRDVAEDARLAPILPMLVDNGVRASLSVPLHHGQRLVGLLVLDSPSPVAWSPIEVRTLRAIADFLELALRDARARQELRTMTERLRTLVDGLPDGILVEDRARRVVFVNMSLRRMFGVPDGVDMIGVDCDASLDEQKATFAEPERGVLRVRELIARAAPVVGEEVRFADGRILERDFLPVHIDARSEGFMWVYRDVTQSRKLVDQLQAVERLRALGTLAAGIAHEINNPLTYVLVNLELLAEAVEQLEAPAPRGELAAMVEESREGAERVQEIVRSLRAFSRSEKQSPPEPTDLHAAVLRALLITQSELRRRATVETMLEAKRLVMADEGRIVQVVVNLVMNAAQAFGERSVAENRIRLLSRDEDDTVVLEVHDNGPGIPAEAKARVFEPFFTTKAVGYGTGLGLSICHGIVTTLGGRIELESEWEKGTVARVVLRAAPAGAVATTAR